MNEKKKRRPRQYCNRLEALMYLGLLPGKCSEKLLKKKS
jgi:hypothetical protein